MSSVFGIPVSSKASMHAYKAMIQRVTRVANNFEEFITPPFETQTELLKHNYFFFIFFYIYYIFRSKKEWA